MKNNMNDQHVLIVVAILILLSVLYFGYRHNSDAKVTKKLTDSFGVTQEYDVSDYSDDPVYDYSITFSTSNDLNDVQVGEDSLTDPHINMVILEFEDSLDLTKSLDLTPTVQMVCTSS